MQHLRPGIAAFAATLIANTGALALDQTLPAYRPVGSLSGQIISVGSDTLGHEMAAWAKAFRAALSRRQNYG